MQKPNNYDETQAHGDFTPVELGGHYLVIKQVEETKSSAGQDMIKISFDFDKNDIQPGYFAELFKNDIRPDKKWSNQATQHTLVYDQDGKTSRSFKTFCTCVEHSNPGFAVNWGDNWGAQFKNKKIGGVFGEELDWYEGKEKHKRVLRWFVSTDKVDGAAIPELKETKAHKDQTAINSGDFMNIPDSLEEELPFA